MIPIPLEPIYSNQPDSHRTIWPPLEPGDRTLTPLGMGTVEQIPCPGEAVVRGDDWMFYGTFPLERLTPLVGRAIAA